MSWDDVQLIADHLGRAAQVRVWEYQAESVSQGVVAAHQETEITWVERGCLVYWIGGGDYRVPAGSAMIVPGGVKHRTDFLGPGDVVSVRLGADVISQAARAVTPPHRAFRFTHMVVTSSQLVAIGRLIRTEVAVARPGQLRAIAALSEALAVEVLRSSMATDTLQDDPRIQRALERIANGYDHELTVADLADAAGLSRFHFSRRFRQVVGQSPYQCLLETRLARAAALLRRGDQNVTDAALSAGFSDFGRFSRMFHRKTGQTPSEYRRNHSPPTGSDISDAVSGYDSLFGRR